MTGFGIKHLSDDELLEAWPVARMSDAHANSDWWVNEAAGLIERGGGVLAARAPDGNIHGVATYEVAKQALLGRVLTVNTLITLELSHRAPARRALYKALEELAGAFDCRSIVLPLPSTGHIRDRTKLQHGLIDFERLRDLD